VRDFLTFANTAAAHVGYNWDRDCRQIGKVIVFYPYRLSAVTGARYAVSARLAVSLTSAQMDTMSAEGGVAFQSLTNEQKQLARYLVETETILGHQFPEPELSKRLAKARVILGLHPFIFYSYSSAPNTTTSSGFYLSSKAEGDLYAKWAPGQIAAGRMAVEAQMKPGPDAPGDSTELELRGIYSLADILKMIQERSDAPLVAQDADKTRMAAYCKLPAAALARACAVALGTAWRKDNGKWVLGSDEATGAFSLYASSKNSNDYYAEYSKLQPRLTPLARSGKCVYIADEDWADLNWFTDMVDKKTVPYNELTQPQQDHLQKAREAQIEAYKHYNMPELPNLKMNWDPNLKLYIATDDAILYDEWLDYELEKSKS